MRVEDVDAHARDFVRDVLDLDFLVGDLRIGMLSLLDQVGAALLNCLLLRGVVRNVVTDLLGFVVKRHDAFL